MFGKLSDREIGRRTGLHRKTIGEARRSLGVRSAPRRATTEADRSWVPSVRHLLGKVTDAELGKRVGRSGATVGMARRELGIKRGHRRPAVHGSDKAPLTNALLRSRRSATEIAHMTGIAVSTIYGRRRSMGVPTPARRS